MYQLSKFLNAKTKAMPMHLNVQRPWRGETCTIGLGSPMLTSDICFVLGLGEGIGALPANVSSLTLGERLSSSSARTWKFAGYSLMQPILGPTPVLHMLDIGLFSSTLVPNWHTFSLPQLLAVALAPTLPSMCSNGSSSFTGLEGGTSSSIGSLCSRQQLWNYIT